MWGVLMKPFGGLQNGSRYAHCGYRSVGTQAGTVSPVLSPGLHWEERMTVTVLVFRSLVASHPHFHLKLYFAFKQKCAMQSIPSR